MEETKLFIDWINGPYISSFEDENIGIIRRNNFIMLHNEFSNIDNKKINKFIVDNILYKVDFNKMYNGEYIYKIVIDILLNYLKIDRITKKILKHIYYNVDSKNSIPQIIGEYKNVDDFLKNIDKIKRSGQILSYYLHKYSEFIYDLYIYIPNYKNIKKEYYIDIVNFRDYESGDFLNYLKYLIENQSYY